VDAKVVKALRDEQDRRAENRQLIAEMHAKDPSLAKDPVLQRWAAESRSPPAPLPEIGELLPVRRVMGDPAHVKERIAFAKSPAVKKAVGKEIKWDPEDLYGYGRAFATPIQPKPSGLTVLDPTAGGGSIPFEALRLGHNVIANELNPVATTILYATLDYPARYGVELVTDIRQWGRKLLDYVEEKMEGLAPFSELPEFERERLREHLGKCPEILPQFDVPEYDHTGLIYCRQVTCPHCGGEAPLLNTMWLSKEAGDPWGVRVVTDGKPGNGKVSFDAYRVHKGEGPNGEDPNEATVNRGVGQCVHCKQAIDGDEIKRQARGESDHGAWTDRLYAVVAVRFQPKLDKHGQPLRYKSGARKGEIKTQKVRFFRPPNERDLEALTEAERRLQENWSEWEAADLIPTENIPEGNDMRPVRYGMPRWCDLFTPRQLLGHLYLAEGLQRLASEIVAELGSERGRAVVTYLQFAIDKGVDYNSKQTRWHFSRGVLVGTFGRHDFSLKWTFGEMTFTGPQSGAAWGLSQVIDAYSGIAELAKPVNRDGFPRNNSQIRIVNGTGAYLSGVEDGSVDLVCMDPPYYDNVQYGELSDFYYVWQRRTLEKLYPQVSWPRLVNKVDEAVANPVRDASAKGAYEAYERMMQEIFRECRRALKDDGIMTLMFTHKSQEAWEALTQSLIQSGWDITASFPVESEGASSIHQRDMAAAASSIFIACRKRPLGSDFPASWTGLGGQGVQHRIRDAVVEGLREFEPLRLNPVDEMVASYGRALHVLSQNWPVMDGDDQVSPIRAMNEASRVVAENQIRRITDGRLRVDDLDPETAMALTLYGIYGLYDLAYDEALNLSRSLNIRLEGKAGGYRIEQGESFIGINQDVGGRGRTARTDDSGYAAPLVRRGSKLRLARPEERDKRRLDNPQTDWDRLHGLLMAYRKGDLPVARQYLAANAADQTPQIIDLLEVWAREMDDDISRKEAEALLFGFVQ
jgi:adenine-specific DNA methylase